MQKLICSIDVETTGLDCSKHDPIEVAIVPLDYNLKPLKQYNGIPLLPFCMNIKPLRPQSIGYFEGDKFIVTDHGALNVNKKNIHKLLAEGPPQSAVLDAFEEYLAKLDNPKVCPLGQNYCFDKGFLMNLFGPLHYEEWFDYNVRDLKSAVMFLHDRQIQRADDPTFTKFSLAGIAKTLGVINPNPHSALGDAITTAECYRILTCGPA